MQRRVAQAKEGLRVLNKTGAIFIIFSLREQLFLFHVLRQCTIVTVTCTVFILCTVLTIDKTWGSDNAKVFDFSASLISVHTGM